MIMKRTISAYKIITALLICCSILSCSKNKTPEKPPRGYLNETLLKISYATKLLKLIDTEPAIPEELEVFEGLEYKTVDSISLQLDIYKQKKQKEKAPVLIFIHGGSWSKGKRSDYLPYLVDYAMKGYVTATISYRLVKVAKYPAAVEDVKCAIKWIKDNAEKYGIDPNRIALIGGSAGAHLAMMAGYDSNKGINQCESTSNGKVQAVVNLYGPVDLTTPYARETSGVTNFLGKTWQQAPELFLHASPKTYITSDDPPTLTFHGTLDSLVPVSQADSLNSWLTQAGVVSEYHRLKGWPHTMDLAQKVNDYCQHHMDIFLKKHL
jgi:acetyl esterase/lipase